MDEGIISEEEGRRLYEERYGKDTKVEGEPRDLAKGDETSSVGDMLDALEEGKWANPPALDTPTESFPDWSDAVPTGIIPDDAETSI